MNKKERGLMVKSRPIKMKGKQNKKKMAAK